VADSPSSLFASREVAPDLAGLDGAVFRGVGFFAAGVASADGAGLRVRFAFDSASAGGSADAAVFEGAGFAAAGFEAAGFEAARGDADRAGSAPRRVGVVGTERVTGRFTGVNGTSPLSDGRPAPGFVPSEEGSGMLPLL
jgi:hypothetical protein